ncbi:hypothetical protein CYMTET_31225 [Cymbomonas tetramitiformis]|uniref:Uncharacterized protein n=1 Tax=Cymbomonas tetramitiformis TaxID=36881 RepID=A0AAE0KT64_9CHLO|nr:hypothetical protein CYMTET_31225 [Cymbomonas tetramitiformis]
MHHVNLVALTLNETITHADWVSTKELAAKIGSALATDFLDQHLRGQYELFLESLLEKINVEYDSSLSFAEITTNDTAYEYLLWVATKGFSYGVWVGGTIGFKYADDRQAEEYLSTLEDQGVGTKHYVALMEILDSDEERYYVKFYENFDWPQVEEETAEEQDEEQGEDEEVATLLQ